MSVNRYYPEMGDEKPDCQIEARLSYYYKNHYILYTHIELSGQGIRFDGNRNADPNDKKKYIVTQKAFNRIQESYSVSMECLL